MNLYSRFTATSLCLAMCLPTAYAEQDIQIIGKIQQQLPKPQQSNVLFQTKAPMVPSITLLKIQLSDHAWEKLEDRAEISLTAPKVIPAHNGYSKVQLGMNQVPVLDQGQHGSCATFANMAALDAVLNKGDYISELCHLQLGQYLENNGYGMSGWDGSMGPFVLNQIQTFGLVSKQIEHTKGCGGLTEYPTNSENPPDTSMSLEEFHSISEPLPDYRIGWSPVLDAYQVYVDKIDTNKTFKDVIAALNAGDRLTFGVLLFNTDQGVAGAVGKNQAKNDSWVLTPSILSSIKNHGECGGHEMVITGYDDEAIAIDDQGEKHKGLFTLRNSWGKSVGHQGDFYMSYDYFKTLVIEVQRIRSFA